MPVTRWGCRCYRLVLIASLIVGSLITAPALPVMADSPPAAPVIVNPAPRDVVPSDVHMEVAGFEDPDGDSHQATDWEIMTDRDRVVVWAGYGSSQLVHAHLDDGSFQGPLVGQRQLKFRTGYLFRVRFQDSRGRWSDWSERAFGTRIETQIPDQLVTGLLARPAPTWRTDAERPLSLPTGASLTLKSGDGVTLLTIAPGPTGLVATPGGRTGPNQALRLDLEAPPEQALELPTSRLSVVTDEAKRLTIFLPAIQVRAGDYRVLWVTESGATFYGSGDETHPTRRQLARDVAIPWQLEAGYKIEAVGATFQLPTTLAFVENPGTDPAAPRYYVTELYGRIKVVTNDGRVFNFADNLLNVNPTGVFPGSGELGVIGICLSPTSRDVYTTTIYRDQAGSLRNRMLRITTDDGLRATRIDELFVVRSGGGLARPSHQIQQCSFGPDGKLYTFLADGPDPANALDDRTFHGKVLRLNPDGSAATDNPFYNPQNPTAALSYQFTKGHRNAYGMTWRADGFLYLTENGPNVDRLVRIERGRNYGWDGTDDSMLTNAVYVWPENHHSPVGLVFIEGRYAGVLPPAKQGRLLIANAGPVYARGPQLTGKTIVEFVMEPDGSARRMSTNFMSYRGEGQGSIVDLRLQSDGLYFTDLYLDDGEGGATAPGGKIWRIWYTGQAAFTPSVTSGPAPLTVALTNTSTLTGTPYWEFGDGSTAAEAAPTHTFNTPGRYVVSLTVTGADGTVDEVLAVITVTAPDGSVPVVTDPVALPAPAAPAIIRFPEVGTVLGGGFKYFWEQNGGLLTFGYPLTQEFQEISPTDGKQYTVQYFERARFEYHPEHKETPYETQLGLLGRQITTRRLAEPPFLPIADPGNGARFFAETRHSLSGVFRERWEQSGGLDLYGLPISEAFQEVSPSDGKPYLVQYFERSRFELHPEWSGSFDEVRIARLGTAIFTRRPSSR